MLVLVGNPEDRFSHKEAHMMVAYVACSGIHLKLSWMDELGIHVPQLLQQYFRH